VPLVLLVPLAPLARQVRVVQQAPPARPASQGPLVHQVPRVILVRPEAAVQQDLSVRRVLLVLPVDLVRRERRGKQAPLAQRAQQVSLAPQGLPVQLVLLVCKGLPDPLGLLEILVRQEVLAS
jgi:hypothetical protein